MPNSKGTGTRTSGSPSAAYVHLVLTVKRAIYLLLALPLGTFWFVWFVTVFSTGLGLAVTLIGLPIIVGGLWSIRWAADLERRLARALLSADVQVTYRKPTRPGWWPTIQARLADGQTWRDFGYLLCQFPFGIATFTLVVVFVATPLSLVFAPVYFWAIPDGIEVGLLNADTLGEAFALTAVGIPLTWIGLKALELLGAMQAAWARVMLTSTPDPELTAQVSDARSAQARIIEAADAERRRLERDLHDGAQQRLVSLSLKLAMAKAKVGEDGDARALLEEAHEESKAAVTELRDLARGIHPAILTDRGLAPALDELAARATVPTEVLAAPEERLQPAVEATAYFVVAEALANVAKYAEATQASVRVDHQDDRLVVEIRDDGRGGADPANGSGLRGLADRVGALAGRFEVDSTSGWGTRVRAELPLSAARTSG
jgi:signal transduction histidine kinase